MKQQFFDRIDKLLQRRAITKEAEQLKERIREWQEYDLLERSFIEEDLKLLENRYSVMNVFR